MSTSEIALRYSKALFNSASSKNFEKQLNDLALIEKVLSKPQIKQFLSDPRVNITTKKEILIKNFRDSVDNTILSLLLILLDYKRLKNFSEIVSLYKKLVHNSQGIMTVLLTTATPLDDEAKMMLIKKLESSYQKKIVIKEKIDPQLIGGGTLSIGNRMIDFSLKGKLSRLKEELLDTNIHKVS